MIWQDLAILLAQAVMLVSLWPTLRDRSRWPHQTTCIVTGLALGVVAIALASLALWASTGIVALLACAWLRMAVR